MASSMQMIMPPIAAVRFRWDRIALKAADVARAGISFGGRLRNLTFCVIIVSMKRQTVITKKRRGPPPTGIGTLIGVRMQPNELTALDAWISSHDAKLTRPQAIRRLVELGMKAKPARATGKQGHRLRAQELATKAIEKMSDPSALPEERAQRRRQLTKGPSEFRDDRVDQPKAKGNEQT